MHIHVHCHSVREYMVFTSDLLVGKTAVGQRQTIKEQGTRQLATQHSVPLYHVDLNCGL